MSTSVVSLIRAYNMAVIAAQKGNRKDSKRILKYTSAALVKGKKFDYIVTKVDLPTDIIKRYESIT